MLNPLHNQYDHEQLWALDRDHFLHPWTHFDSFKKEGSLVLAKGDGCHVTDTEGRQYFDGIGGMWCVNVGYGRDELAQTMAEQASQLAYSKHICRRFQCAGGPVVGQAGIHGAGLPEPCDVCADGISRQ